MKKKVLLSLFVVIASLLSFSVKAQIIYGFAASSGAYTANTPGSSTVIVAASTDDGTSASTNINFTFTYGCVNYTTFQASSNGVMFLGTAGAGTNVTNNLNSSTDRPAIGPLWDDLKTSGTGNVNCSLTGIAPNRIMTIEWLNMLWQYNAGGISVSFQVKLYETSNKIDFVYNLISAGNINGGASASIGLGGATNSDFYSLNNSGAAPTPSKVTETTSINTSPANGQVYSWTPSCPTITTGAVNPTTFNLASCAATATATVAFTSTGTYNTGNYYTAWLSDASGSFGTATSIGTFSSTANTGTINVTIPAGTLAGTGYLIQISSYTPAITGSNSSSFTVTTSCVGPGVPVSGVMSNYATINAAHPTAYGCDNGCSETTYTVGPFTHPAVCDNDNVTSCSTCGSATQSITFTITAGCTYTAEAEVKARGAGCPDAAMDIGDQIHISGTGGTLVSQYATLTSPGACSSVGVVAGLNSYGTADLSNGCGNSNGYAQLVYTAPAGAIAQVTISYTSDRADEILTYTFTANSAACGIIVLPIELMGFYAYKVDEGIKLNWATATETNNAYFMVEYSLDGSNFMPYTEVKGAGNSYVEKDYTCRFTENIGNKKPYFRLKQVDYNGNYHYSSIITLGSFIGSLTVQSSTFKAYYNSNNDGIVTKFHLDYPQQVNLSLYDVTGAKIQETGPVNYSEGNNEIILNSPDKAGMYVLVYQVGDATPIRKKIIVAK
ncbi:MAG TPA: T9SS type A sorting domain-containing protein [Bacteroidia bacterium]|nr:T9SS type A sorting domain-containing protein [Bacteroidia bacterium]